MKKILAIIVGILLAGSTASLAQDKSQEKARAKVQNKEQNLVRAKNAYRHQFRFIDENGDGIADVLRDHDGDGIPNGQDPDWTRPGDGTGYQDQNRYGKGTEGAGRAGLQAGQTNRVSFGKGSFRGGLAGSPGLGAGTNLCDGAGPKGRMIRRGRG